jgi:hypothetical protein
MKNAIQELLTNLLTYLLTPSSRIPLEKLTGFQLVKKFLAFYGTPRFITALTSVPILSQLDPVHTATSHFLKIHLKIILPSTPGSPKWSLSLRFPHQNPVHASPLPHTRYMPRHLFLLDFITRRILGEEYTSFSFSLCSFIYSPDTSSLLGPNILLNSLFSNTLNLRSSLNVSDKVTHPYKTTGKL